MKIKRLAIIVLCLIVLSLTMIGCGKTTNNGNPIIYVCDGVSLIKVTDNSSAYGSDVFNIYVHKETRVMYILNDVYYRGAISIMLDENGKPMLWEGEL